MELPDFLIEMSKQMNSDPSRMTAHPYWQVRTKEFLVTEEGYNEHHWEIIDSEIGSIYRSDLDPLIELGKFIKEHHQEYFERFTFESSDEDYPLEDDLELFADVWEPSWHSGELPEGMSLVYVQEVEKVLSTHLTQSDAEWFINRCKHHYSTELYTYVASAYWSPQFKELQDWIKSITAEAA